MPEKLHLVDIWGSKRYCEKKALAVSKKFSKELQEGIVAITRALSIEAAEKFKESYFDWIYIDTDHRYKTTLAELYAYKDKIKKDGYIAGHDYSMGNWAKGSKYGVIEAVAEFCVLEGWKLAYLTADHTENQSFVIQRIN